MRRLGILFLLFTEALCAPRKSVDPREAEERVVGGIPSEDPTNFPYLVSFQETDGNNFAAGTILDVMTVLTATSSGVRYFDFAIAGEYNIYVVEEHEQKFSVAGNIQHDRYWEYDLAIVKIEGNFEFNEYVQVVNLPSTRDQVYPTGTLTTLVGWGQHYSGSPDSDIPYFVGLGVTNFTICQAKYYDAQIVDLTPGATFCAGYLGGGKGDCGGDRGGPLLLGYNETSPETFYPTAIQIGVLSDDTVGCADPEWPGVYVSTSWFFDFIADHSDYPVPP